MLQPLKRCADSYVDDTAVFSDEWSQHMGDLESFLQAISRAGMTLNLKKCEFAKSRVKFVGQLIGSGQRSVDPGRLKAVKNMKPPQSKKQVRQIMGFFSYFRDYIPNFSALAKPLTDLTTKRVPNQVPWGHAEQSAFEKLKTELCKATDCLLYTSPSPRDGLLSRMPSSA